MWELRQAISPPAYLSSLELIQNFKEKKIAF